MTQAIVSKLSNKLKIALPTSDEYLSDVIDEVISQNIQLIHNEWINATSTDSASRWELTTEFRDLLQKEFRNELKINDHIRLIAFKEVFNYEVEYSVEGTWDVVLVGDRVSYEVECEDREEALAIMNGEKDLEEPDYSYIRENADDFELDGLNYKQVNIFVGNIALKSNSAPRFSSKLEVA